MNKKSNYTKKRKRNRLKTFSVWLVNIFLIFSLLLILSILYVKNIEPNWFEVVPVNLKIPNLPKTFNGFKIVQISDIHADDSMTEQKLTKIVRLIDRQDPDIVAITGDFITKKTDATTTALLENTLSKLSPQEKTIAVLGNHDHWSNPEQIRNIIHNSNILDLSNSVYTLERERDKLNIAGVDDYWANKARLDLVLQKLPTEGIAILIVHEPDFADISSTKNRFALQISGHSHGGQVKIPFRKPPVLPPYGQKYPSGLYRVGNMIQYTNIGVGMVKPLVRFNCRPEITVFTLNSSDRA